MTQGFVADLQKKLRLFEKLDEFSRRSAVSKSLSDVTDEELLHLEVTEIAERKNLSIKM